MGEESFKQKNAYLFMYCLVGMKTIHHVDGVSKDVRRNPPPALARSSHCLGLANRASIFMCKPMSNTFYVKAMSTVQLAHIIIGFIFLLHSQVWFYRHIKQKRIRFDKTRVFFFYFIIFIFQASSPDKCCISYLLVLILGTNH